MSEKSQEIRLRSPQERLSEALADGDIQPSLVLELFYYASEPDLVAVMRAVAALDPATRLRVLAFARGLALPGPDVTWAERKIDA